MKLLLESGADPSITDALANKPIAYANNKKCWVLLDCWDYNTTVELQRAKTKNIQEMVQVGKNFEIARIEKERYRHLLCELARKG